MTAQADTTESRHDRPGRSLLVLLGFAVAVVAVAGLGGLATAGNVEGWYADAEKPPYNPPNWLFGPVWSVLYAAMAIAAWLVWRRGGDVRLWWVQLGVNLAWTPVSFGLEQLWLGLAVIVVLDVLVAVVMVRFWQVSRVAGALIAPYLAWVLFATALNAGLAVLN